MSFIPLTQVVPINEQYEGYGLRKEKDTNIFQHRRRFAPLSAPVAINLEITSGCHLKCRHCYNYWREDSDSTADAISIEQMDELIELIIDAQVFHVVLTGGEPLMNFKTLERALRRLTDEGISNSMNSTLHQLTPKKAQQLADAGLDHVLVQLDSAHEETNDYMMNRPGVLKATRRGIKTAVDAGIRVSINMVVSESNQDHVYDTAKLASELGVQKIFGTRLVPSVRAEKPDETDLRLDRDKAMEALDNLLKAREDFGIQVGTLISYPLCVLGDLNKYADFVGRGCPAQTGNRMVINASGTAHACTHEEFAYGNVYELGIRGVFKRMRHWHDGSYLFDGCRDCVYIDTCGSGCRMASHAYFKEIDAKDPMWVGWEHIGVPFKLSLPSEVWKAIEGDMPFSVPDRLRFRDEGGFHSINVRWADAFQVESELALLLEEKQERKETLSIKDVPDMGNEAAKVVMAGLVHKDAIEPVDRAARLSLLDRPKGGANISPRELPIESWVLP